MTREEILEQFTINENGVIRTPGKFEGEMLYTPYFYDRMLDGGADFEDCNIWGFQVQDRDVTEFPELNGINCIALEQSETGFIDCTEHESLKDLEDILEAVYNRELTEE